MRSKSPGVRAANMGRSLIEAIMHGNAWICGPDKLARLRELAWVDYDLSQIDSTIAEWKAGNATIFPSWHLEDRPTFWLLQYTSLTEEQLRLKLAQLPKGVRFSWQFRAPGQIYPPMAKQEALYERMRTVAEEHGTKLEKANHP